MKVVAVIRALDKKGRQRDLKAAKQKYKVNRCRLPLKAKTYMYYAIGDGVKRVFALKDAIPGYESWIPDPNKVSLVNVFVEGMLQASHLYEVHRGAILFVSDQPPPADSRIIAQFIIIKGI